MRYFMAFLLLYSHAVFAANTHTWHFDFPDFEIGIAENPKGPTGATLFYFPNGAHAAIDIRGGSVGTFFTQDKMHAGDAAIDGVMFCGGGILGLEAVSGAIAGIFENTQNQAFKAMPLISGGVIFDYTPRNNTRYPDHALGKKAFLSRQKNTFTSGQAGVGMSATMGKLFGQFTPAGQGGAFGQFGETKIAVFTVVNAVGVVLNEEGHIINPTSIQSKKALKETAEKKLATPGPILFQNPPQNTTLTLVITNEKLAPRHLQQMGKSVHHALSQAIYPYATVLDGDLVYTVSTQTRTSDLYQPGPDIENDLNLKLIYLSAVAGELAKAAVRDAVVSHSGQTG